MQYRNRAILVLIVLSCGFTVISFNLVQIQLVQHAKFWRMAIENHLHPEELPARRGTIFDRDGNILAQTKEVCDVRLDGKLLDHPETDLPKIANILQMPVETLQDAFNPRNRDQLIQLDVEDSTVSKLKELKLSALIYKTHDLRSYPNNEMAAHVLGFMNETGHGVTGMEKELDDKLCGIPGQRLVERDAKHHEIAGYQTRETPAIDGNSVTLTIRMAIQHVVEDELDQIVQTYTPNAAYIIVMDPHTGEIMAMGSRPTFDPNVRKTYTPDSIRDRCVTDMVEPGSVFKTITFAGALNEGLINLETPIFCENGSWAYGGKVLHDDEPHGMLPAEEVFSQSSNIGTGKIAVNFLHEDKLYHYATAFGIGQRTGLFSGQGESSGLLRPVSKWSALSITRIPMGQEVAATPLQLVTAMSVIANGGKLMQPLLAREVKDPTGHVVSAFQPKVVREVISENAARDVAKALEQVTIDGTAKGVKIEGYSYAGKTGTAQKFVDGAYSHTKFVSSFIGFMPVEDPAFVALVMVDEPHTTKYYGAEVSLPVFASIGKQVVQILNLPPDLPTPPTPAPVLSANAP